jgi:hypothetical protein
VGVLLDDGFRLGISHRLQTGRCYRDMAVRRFRASVSN